MKKPSFTRARNPVEKEARKSAILSAAAALLEEMGLARVSLNGIARRAELAKSNLYRYFCSREEIFLHLLVDAQSLWVERVETELAVLAGCRDPVAVGRVLARTAVDTPRLCELSASMASVLEQNIKEDTVLWFREGTAGFSIRIGNAVCAALPDFPKEETPRILRYLYSAVAGLWPSAHPSKAVATALEKPHLAVFRCHFAEELEIMACALLKGLDARDADADAGAGAGVDDPTSQRGE